MNTILVPGAMHVCWRQSPLAYSSAAAAILGRSFAVRYQGTKLSWSKGAPPLATASTQPLLLISSAQRRAYTSASSGGELKRAFPRYDIYDTACMLSVKPLPPTYKSAGADGITVTKQGRIMLEFMPVQRGRNAKGRYDYNKKGLFSLSVDEIGTILAWASNSPKVALQFSRGDGATGERYADEFDEQHIVMSTSIPEKVLVIAPERSGHVTFTFDFVLNGTGGQIGNTSLPVPLSATASPGEFEVLRCLFRDSLKHLTGWDTMMKINDKSAMNDDNRLSTNSFTSQRFSTGGPGAENSFF